MPRFYGDITLRLDGRFVQLQGTCELTDTGFERTPVGNEDGSVVVVKNPTPPRLSVSFDRSGLMWDDRMMNAPVDITLQERSNGRQHIITNAAFVGNPRQNIKNGQVTGAEFTWDPDSKQTVGGG